MVEFVEYLDEDGRSPFALWRDKLDDIALARVTRSMARLEHGNTSNLKGVGGGVVELKVDFGPGYRVYLAWDGLVLILLLGGGTKKRQQLDIELARSRLADYRRRKR